MGQPLAICTIACLVGLSRLDSSGLDELEARLFKSN